jgi:hypothetical protein
MLNLREVVCVAVEDLGLPAGAICDEKKSKTKFEGISGTEDKSTPDWVPQE